MKKIIITLFIVLNLHAQTYEGLLELAINNNAQLQIAQSQGEQAELQGQMTTRLENPNVEFELSNFSNRRFLRENQVGARVGATQSLLLPWVKEDKQRLTQTQVEEQEQSFRLSKADFIYRFNRQYLVYKEAVKKKELEAEALEISKKIVAVAQGRFNGGSIAKSELLQAKIEQNEVLSQFKAFSLQALQEKNRLLRLANVETSFDVDAEHTFVESTNSSTHPLLELTKKREQVAKAKLNVASHSVETIGLFSEIEAEPDQDIFRVGVSIPLPVFNNKSQEKQLAKIALNNQKLALETQQRALDLELPQLRHEIEVQEALKNSYEALAEEQKSLLKVYQSGYSIAKINILKLSTLKNALLITQKELLATNLSIERNSIKINYLQGAYNE